MGRAAPAIPLENRNARQHRRGLDTFGVDLERYFPSSPLKNAKINQKRENKVQRLIAFSPSDG